MLQKIAAVSERINSRMIRVSKLLGCFQSTDGIDVTRLGRFQASPPTCFESLIRAGFYVDEE